MNFVYLSLGTNIEIEVSAVGMIRELCRHFGTTYCFPFTHTIADGLDTQAPFLNSVAIIPTPRTDAEIKATLNAIETGLGRDRNDPRCAEKDRHADIDIIARTLTLANDLTQHADALAGQPPYITTALDHQSNKMDLSPWGLPHFIGCQGFTFDGSDLILQARD